MKIQDVAFSRLNNWLPKQKIVPESILRVKRAKYKRNFVHNLKIIRGGKCEICGYDKNLAAINFHHIQKKNFGLSTRDIVSHSFEEIVEEVMKCRLLCSNCHQDLHHPHLRK